MCSAIHRFSSFLQQYCILLREIIISTCAVRKMAAQCVSGNNNRTVTIQVLASTTLSAYSTTSVYTPCTSTHGKSNSRVQFCARASSAFAVCRKNEENRCKPHVPLHTVHIMHWCRVHYNYNALHRTK